MCSVNLTSMGFVKSVAHNIPSWITCWIDFHLQNVPKLPLFSRPRPLKYSWFFSLIPFPEKQIKRYLELHKYSSQKQ